MAYGVISNAVTPLWVAQDQGLFRKYGLDPDLVFIIAGTATQAMLAGQVPFGLLAITHVANAVAAGGDLTMVLSFFNSLDYLFVSQASIKSVEELKGKRVGNWNALRLTRLNDFYGSRPLRSQSQERQYHSAPDRKCSRTHGGTACGERRGYEPSTGAITRNCAARF